MLQIPGEVGWVQNTKGDGLGTLQETFNIDLESNQGKVRIARSKRIAYTGSPTGFGQIAALERFKQKLYVAAENGSAHDIWVGNNSPFDTLVNDTTSVEIVPLNTDILAWNDGLYLSTGNELYYSTDGTAWNEIGANVLTSGDAHLLASLNAVLYVTDQEYKVFSVTSANSFQGSGSQTLNLNMPGWGITVLMAGLGSIWVGLSNNDGGSISYMFEWDGQTANTPTARYEIDASAIMAGVVKDGIPYIVDSRGRLMAFNGGAFVEVARFPLKGRTFKGFNLIDHTERAIHPRGMVIDADEILINVANRTDEITDEDYNEFPSGVWGYSEDNGLYHKLSPSYQAPANTGVTGLTDYGQYRCYSGGPMMVFESVSQGGDPDTPNGGRIVFALEYFIDADDTSSDTQWGLFTDDTNDNTQKAGWLVTARILSSYFKDNWSKIYTALSDLSASGDLVEIKYRTKDETPTYFTGTWTGTDRFSTNTELTAYEQGDEITIVQGKGGGAVAHAKTLTSGAGSEVVFDRDITGITVGQTSKFRIEKWVKVGKIENLSAEGFTIGKKDHWIQFKTYLQWTGRQELYGMLIENSKSIS